MLLLLVDVTFSPASVFFFFFLIVKGIVRELCRGIKDSFFFFNQRNGNFYFSQF